MKKYSLLVAFSAVLLLAGSVWAAGSKSTSGKAEPMRIHGTIVSSNSSNLVLSSKVKGKVQEETFAINPETKIKGELKAGNSAEIHYKMDNGQKLATNIVVSKAMMAKGR